jgi:hypothetical protein
MKKLLTTFGMILGFITVASAQTTAKPAEALTAKPATKEKTASAVKTDKAVTTTAPVKVEKFADEPISAYANENSKTVSDVMLENEVAPAKVEKPATPAKVATAGKPAAKAKPAKTKN